MTIGWQFTLWRRDPKTPGRQCSANHILFRYKGMGVIFCLQNIEEIVLFLSKEYFDKNITLSPMFRLQYIPDRRSGTLWFAKHFLLGF
jgi:hypothetical protein